MHAQLENQGILKGEGNTFHSVTGQHLCMVADNTRATAGDHVMHGGITFFLLLEELPGIILMPNGSADTDFK